MARTSLIVLLLVLAVVTSSAQSGSVKAIARGGYGYIGFEGEASGSISGEINLAAKGSAELMLVLKDVGGVTLDAQNEAIIFLKSVSRSTLMGNSLTVVGKGTFQGEEREVEVTLTDAKGKNEKDALKVRVLHNGRVEFEHSAKFAANIITITRGR
jgi:hypothetical protein